MMRTVRPLAALNPRCYDRLRSRFQLSIREGRPIIQPFAKNLLAIGFDLDWTLSYYPLSTRQVLQEALILTSHPIEWLGDLALAADQYNALWLELERSTESLDALRFQIMTLICEQRGISDPSAIKHLAQAYDVVRRESGVVAYPGVVSMLIELRTRYRLGLYTNGPTFLQWEKLKALGFDTLFDSIIVAGDVGIYKPDPQAFALLLENLRVNAHQAMFVGDNYDADIVGAHEAGMHTAWIKHDSAVAADRIQPTITVSDPVALREVLL